MYNKVKASALPRGKRASVSKFEKMPEWRMMKADLEKGLKHNEALQLALTAEEKRKYGLKNRLTIARFLKKYLTEHNLPYQVRSFRRDELEFVIVINREGKE